MNLEFIPDGSPDCPLIMMSWSVPEEAEQLRQELRRLASSSETTAALHSLPFIAPVEGYELLAHAAKEDVGARLLENSDNRFTWSLTPQSWQDVVDLLHPMTLPSSSGYQWLDETGEIDILISTRRSW